MKAGYPAGWLDRLVPDLEYQEDDMPRIPDHFLDFVFFLYSSREAAERGTSASATGFFTGIGSRWFSERVYVYAVTVAHDFHNLGPTPVLRLNTVDGASDFIETKREEWRRHPKKDDVLVRYIESLAPPFENKPLVHNYFLTPKRLKKLEIGVGDDVFMVGRFADLDGERRNTPAVRFGTLAMFPHIPLEHPQTALEQDSYLVEMRSIPGYSGSPVLLFIPPYSLRKSKFSREWSGPWLLGMDYGHRHDELLIVNKKTKEPTTKQAVVRGNSGMACVVPAWKILEAMNHPELKKHRDEMEKELEKDFRAAGGTVLD